tara:strand:+ start:920 stop:2188 length:1269 start_codon:yes stop_codon:yes gene_type:complete
MNEKIFIQLASYRDSELIPTIQDCICKADNKQDLVFSIAWQNCEEEIKTVQPQLDSLKKEVTIKEISIPWEESTGVCWARNKLQQQYDGEAYTLQIDSHHRFAPGWDTYLKEQIHALMDAGYEKPLLTAYVNGYGPVERKGSEFPKKFERNDVHVKPCGSVDNLMQDPTELKLRNFSHGGVPNLRSPFILNIENFNLPVKGYLYSGHFCFTIGAFSKEVQHDPEIYFLGEESTIALRAYTHGYDIFHPIKNVVWHAYSRTYRGSRHWDDHEGWWEQDKESVRRCKVLFGVEDGDIDFGEYGLGTKRSRDDYFKESGYDYKRGCEVLRNGKFLYTTIMSLGKETIGEHNINDIDFICCVIHSEDKTELQRIDVTKRSHPELWTDNWCQVDFQFQTDKTPTRCVTWPCLNTGDWVYRQESEFTG